MIALPPRFPWLKLSVFGCAAMVIVVAFAAYVMTLPLDSWFRSGPVANFLWSTDSVLLWAVCPEALCAVLPPGFRIFYLAALAAFIFVVVLMVLQRLFLRVLLSYQNWMVWSRSAVVVLRPHCPLATCSRFYVCHQYERRPSLVTKIWAGILKVLYFAGRKPQLYRYGE